MKWKLAVSLAALAATAAALQSSTGGMANLSPGVALAAPTPRGRLVAAAGLVEPASEARQLEATMVGRLVTLNREEGDHVAAGEVIAEIENADLKAQLAESEAALSVRENELTRLITGARPQEIDQAKAALNESEAAAAEARSNYERQSALGTKKLVSDMVVEQAIAARDTSAARRALAAAQLSLLTAPARKEDVAIARANVDSARGRVNEMRAEIEKTIIRSPVEGKILKLFRRKGETVSNLPPTPIATVGDTSRLRVRADVDQADVANVGSGQTVSITADAFPGKRFRGSVAKIGAQLGHKNFRTNEPNERLDTKVLEVLIDLDPSAQLPIGLPVDVMFDGTATGRPYAESEIRKQPVNRDNRQALKQNVTPEMEPIQISIDFAAKTTSTDWIPRQEQADAGWKPVPEPEGTMLQIGSYAAENIAQRAWSDFRLHHTDVVGDYGAQIRKIDLGTRGVWYRVQFGPLSNASATELCERLRAQNVACLVLSR